ncbi:uncharacterized protein TRIADDRAFT_56375 [Trichoplax adhaerens]|uniref:Importin N-terminal domain-containing protein n=1 Tax=Trichoplax adhaerens TaxID=10228 RepID=B3RXY7_TRIAD|nr:hypothetical protein TRIADDRAFT_56375 [Trichoplax adhaerens]EDV24941.1 hypothetical protein TRIADDRAFT_56375 [Trichoplax adhaerens]|eukprot:XP_002112831.1 hypothetical protein TRIADDRAFT_56375 [Trichoplax adhaerens]
MEVRRTELKVALLESLKCILSDAQHARQQGEDHLNVIEMTPEFGVYLTDIIIDQNNFLPIRQLAAVVLKQYVQTHWSTTSDKFVAPETPEWAYAISEIARWDWPESWPQLFEILIGFMTSSKLSDNMADSQLPQLIPIMFPELIRIFKDEKNFNSNIRGKTTHILNSCISLIFAMSDLEKAAPNVLLFPYIPHFLSAFTESLSQPDGPHSDYVLKTNVIKTIVNNTRLVEESIDSDGERYNIQNLVCHLFEFFSALFQRKTYKSIVNVMMDDLIYQLIKYMLISEEQADLWVTCPGRFIEDEVDDTITSSVRILAVNLLDTIIHFNESKILDSTSKAVRKHFDEAETIKYSPHWWKVHESCLLVLGNLSNLLTTKSVQNYLENNFLLNYIMSIDVQSTVSPFLSGRALWLRSKLASRMEDPAFSNLMKGCTEAVNQSQHIIIRIYGAKALSQLSQGLNDGLRHELMSPYLTDAINGLIFMALDFSKDVDILGLAIDSLNFILQISRSVTESVHGKLIPMLVEFYSTYNQNPYLEAIAQDSFKIISKFPNCYQTLELHLFPVLMNLISTSGKSAFCTTGTALDIMEDLIKNCPIPVPETLINIGFPTVAVTVMNTDDVSIIQSGSDCLRAFISRSSDQVFEWKDPEGNDGLSYVINCILKQVDPQLEQYSAAQVGKLTIVFFRKGDVLAQQHLGTILRGVLAKMQQVTEGNVMQALIIMFAYLIHEHFQLVYNLLVSVPSPTGTSAMEYVLSEWCKQQNFIAGCYNIKISILAFCKILLYYANTNDPYISSMSLLEEALEETIVLKRKVTIPIIHKMFKAIIYEFSTELEGNSPHEKILADISDIPSRTDDEESSSDSQNYLYEDQLYINSSNFEDFDDDESFDDLEDALFPIDLQDQLLNFFQEFRQKSCYNFFISCLSAEEHKILDKIHQILH